MARPLELSSMVGPQNDAFSPACVSYSDEFVSSFYIMDYINIYCDTHINKMVPRILSNARETLHFGTEAHARELARRISSLLGNGASIRPKHWRTVF